MSFPPTPPADGTGFDALQGLYEADEYSDAGTDSTYSEYDSDLPDNEMMGTVDVNELARALMREAGDQDPMPSLLRKGVSTVWRLIDIFNVGLGTAMSAAGLAITIVGAISVGSIIVSIPGDALSTAGFSLVWDELKESLGLYMFFAGVALTHFGKDFANGQEMLHTVTSNLPYMFIQSVIGGHDPYYRGHYGGYYY